MYFKNHRRGQDFRDSYVLNPSLVESQLQKDSSCPISACGSLSLSHRGSVSSRVCLCQATAGRRRRMRSPATTSTHAHARTHEHLAASNWEKEVDAIAFVWLWINQILKPPAPLQAHPVYNAPLTHAPLLWRIDRVIMAGGEFAYSSAVQRNESTHRCTPCSHQVPEWGRRCWRVSEFSP